MGYVQARPTIEDKKIKCPFCNVGEIDIRITSEYMSTSSSFAADGKKARMPNYHPERIDVFSKCPHCNKSKKDIKDAIESGTGKLSHEEKLKRAKKAGMPTMIETPTPDRDEWDEDE
ncbi:MAG: hypothetical protein ABH873_03035 [Candidatus Firestonebacteria bacterium]